MLRLPMSGTKNRTLARRGTFMFKTMYCMKSKKCNILLAIECSNEARYILFNQPEAAKPD